VLEIGRLLLEQFTCSVVEDTGASEFGDEAGLEMLSGTSKLDLASDTFDPWAGVACEYAVGTPSCFAWML